MPESIISIREAKQLCFVTGNEAKAEQLGQHLNYPISHQRVDLVEIQSLDLFEVVAQKAIEAYMQLQKPTLVEDTSLVFKSLGRLPGPFIKWFLQELDNEGLCRLLDGYQDRSALARVLFALYDGHQIKLFSGYMEGTIAQNPRGVRGFGWDPIFIPKGYTKTWGEMDVNEQAQTSMRKIALKKLERYLNAQKP